MRSQPACGLGLPSLTIDNDLSPYWRNITQKWYQVNANLYRMTKFSIFTWWFFNILLYWRFPAGTRTSIWAVGVGSVTSANWEHLYHQRHNLLYWFWACRTDLEIIYQQILLSPDFIVVFIPLKLRITLFLCLPYHVVPQWMVLRYALLHKGCPSPLQFYTESIKTFRPISHSHREHLRIVFLLADIVLVVFLVIAKHVTWWTGRQAVR